MTALATFDPHGQWLSTSVCDQATCPQIASLGVRWGRWPDGHWPALTAGAGVCHTVAPPWLHGLPGHRTQERFRFSPAMLRSREGREHARRHELASEDAVACLVLAGHALFWVRTAQGFTALLLEAGEWTYLPADTPHALDAGGQAELELLRLSPGPRGWFPLRTGRPLPAALPSLDAFVTRLLDQLGEQLETAEPG